ncbi:MAG: DegT/DnrJ/EryC1/StrS family aminotransferase [Bacteroidota bacterium]
MIETLEQEPIYVTRPSMPPLDDFVVHLERIWENRWLTNNGEFHKRLEAELAEFLGVKYVSLFSNGTLALLVALQAMRVSGEVITTPYTFVATTHALHWNEITPVFCDIDPKTYNLDPACIESLITPQTSAILPVHVYGYPCDVKEISRIADIYGLKVIYDACHAFNVRVDNESVLNFGDLSVLSFHATKIFTTLEGGAIITNDAKLKTRIDYLKNFGIANETTVMAPGINGKMNEVQAAFGLLQLQYVEENIQKRKEITDRYRTQLAGVSGLTFLEDIPDVQHNYSYFPIFIDEEKFGFSRDNVFDVFREKNIICRRYFYPLISHFSMYRNLPSAKHLPAAEIAAAQIICLPLYPDLELSVVDQICDVIQHFESLRDELALVA